ncbi:SCO2322 family protein [Streptantibioticus ferralitis]|uniref:SCO2322 family protein n=1 Tax=Streptantibioticus ferralitis TaxID=236510 RepID=A0ABT5Z196_9ACTN|nr:SCO2322 family protein [Streptantibioticus ferralitis]MDF2257603.1 SCO2322 family protein [Streptantibioticus ferralitis]
MTAYALRRAVAGSSGSGSPQSRAWALLAVPLLAATVLLTAGPAQADGYRYWSFWGRDGSEWTYAQTGPATTKPSDGDIEGWRFAVSADSASAAKPRGDAEFSRICANTETKDGMKRIALVLDFGTQGDAPSGGTPPPAHTACAQVPQDASAADALAAVAKPLRYNSAGMVCAIAGYPQSGCGEQVTSGGNSRRTPAPSASAQPSESGNGPSLGVFAGIAAVVVLGAAALWQTRRRRSR